MKIGRYAASLAATAALVLPAAAQQTKTEVLGPDAPVTEDELGTLKIGDKAPQLHDVKWHRGEPIERFETGRIYVLDFWATWCGPCILTMPHMSEVAQKYADDGVHVVGVAIWGSERSVPVEEWLRDPHAHSRFLPEDFEITYAIAEEEEHGTGEAWSPVAESFMRGTMSNSIPTIMIIDRQGRLAWVGGPGPEMDESLDADR